MGHLIPAGTGFAKHLEIRLIEKRRAGGRDGDGGIRTAASDRVSNGRVMGVCIRRQSLYCVSQKRLTI